MGGTDTIQRIISHIQSECEEYFVKYCQSHRTMLWIWMMLCWFVERGNYGIRAYLCFIQRTSLDVTKFSYLTPELGFIDPKRVSLRYNLRWISTKPIRGCVLMWEGWEVCMWVVCNNEERELSSASIPLNHPTLKPIHLKQPQTN